MILWVVCRLISLTMLLKLNVNLCNFLIESLGRVRLLKRFYLYIFKQCSHIDMLCLICFRQTHTASYLLETANKRHQCEHRFFTLQNF